jgi:hypothetical protein
MDIVLVAVMTQEASINYWQNNTSSNIANVKKRISVTQSAAVSTPARRNSYEHQQQLHEIPFFQ